MLFLKEVQKIRLGVFAACAVMALPFGACAEEKSFIKQFIDPEDRHLDASEFLENGGFIPLPIIITEPAVGGGLGIAAAFIKNPEPGSGNDPRRSFLGYIRTQNGSSAGFGGQFGSAFGGNLKYDVILGAGSINLDYFPTGLPQGISFNNEATFFLGSARYRLGQSNWFLGPSVTAINTSVSPNLNGGPTLPPALAVDLELNALGLGLHFDNRDNSFTPNSGTNVVLDARRYDDAFGSDADFSVFDAFAAHFWEFGKGWNLAGMAQFNATRGDTPFFMEPSIAIRGVPFNRYQGDRVLSTEIELRKRMTPRWGAVGFAGYGKSTARGQSQLQADHDAWGVGAGVRYRIARKLGLDFGLDVARGPEDTVVYIQFGHAWARNMD